MNDLTPLAIKVGASMSMSILVSDMKRQHKKLFGLIICHHSTPKYLSHNTYDTCLILGQIISSHIENLLHNMLEEKRVLMKAMIDSIVINHQIDQKMPPPLNILASSGGFPVTHTKSPPTKITRTKFSSELEFLPPLATPDAFHPVLPEPANATARSPYSTYPQTSSNIPPIYNILPMPLLAPLIIPLLPPSPGQDLVQPPLDVAYFERKHAEEILQLFAADYGIIMVQGTRRILGPATALELEFLSLFEQYITKTLPSQIFYTNCLEQAIPEVIPSHNFHTSGVLYVPLASDASTYISLFRFEQVRHVKWAGEPHSTLVGIHPATNRPTLLPRTSFSMWQEEVHGRSREWTDLELETAQNLFGNSMELMQLINLHNQASEEMTMRLRYERDKNLADESNKMKSLFLTNLSHEIRTPLNAIIGMVDLTLATTEVDTVQANYLGTVLHASESLLLLINGILDIGKIEAGKMVIVPESFLLLDLVVQATNTYKKAFELRHIKFLCEVEASTAEGKVLADSKHLWQVLHNLLSNSYKYIETGSVVVRIYTVQDFTDTSSLNLSPKFLPHFSPSKQQEGSVIVHFSVSDTGIGIPTGKYTTIFEPFNQINTSLTRDSTKTGLGLSICWSIIHLMGGQLWYESEEGVGSHFHFEIPLIPVTPSSLQFIPMKDDYMAPSGNIGFLSASGTIESPKTFTTSPRHA